VGGMSRKATKYLLVMALALLPASAYANVGLPMIAVAMPAFVVALIPIILIEAYVFARAGFPFKWALQRNAIANVVTTFVGIPLTWGVLLLLQIATVGTDCSEATDSWPQRIFAMIANSPWMCPFEPALIKWMVPVAMLILLVPFFFVSWLLEAWIIRMIGRSFDGPRITAVCLRANLATYALLALYPIGLYFVA
jgi:hypothetical protein